MTGIMTAEIFMQQLPAKQAEFSGSGKKSLNWPMRTAYGKGLELKLAANKLQWRHRYTFEGKPREYVIGYYPLFDFHKAADQHRLNMQAITSGTDPLVERQQGKAAAKEKAIKQAQDVITWSDIFREHTGDDAFTQLKDRSQADTIYVWNRYFKEYIGGLSVQRTSWEQIEDHLIAVRDGTYSIKAGHAVEACRKGKLLIDALWHRASRKGLCEGGAMQKILMKHLITKAHKKSATNMQEIDRQRVERAGRVLSPFELAHAWKHLSECDHPYAYAVRFMFLTGVRRGEACGALSENLINKAGKQSLVLKDTKNGTDFEVILSPEAVEVIRKAQQWHAELVDGSQPVHIFSTAPAGRTKMDGNNLAAWLRAFRRKHCPDMPTWSSHDCRRTFTTLSVDELGKQDKVVDRCINHADVTGTAARYNKAKKAAAMADVWASFGAYVANGCQSPDGSVVVIASRMGG